MSDQKDSPEEKKGLGSIKIPWPGGSGGSSGTIKIPSANEIANKVADKVVGPVASKVKDEMSRQMDNLRKQIDSAVKSAVKPLLPPSIPALKRFLDPGYINKIASDVINTGHFDNIEALMNLPSAAKMESLPRHFLTDLLNSVDRLLDELNLAANKAVNGGLPTIGTIKNTISSHKSFIDNIGDDIFALIKYSPGHIDFNKTVEMIDSHTAELKKSLEAPTVSSKGMSSDARTACTVLLIVGVVLVCIANVLNWIGDYQSLSVGIGLDVGVAAGIKAGVSLDSSIINWGAYVFGGLGMILSDVSEICRSVSDIIQL